MSYHRSVFADFGRQLPADINGFVPEPGDGPWDLDYDHGGEATHDDGELTRYGDWWESVWPEYVQHAQERAHVAAQHWYDGWRETHPDEPVSNAGLAVGVFGIDDLERYDRDLRDEPARS